MPWPPTWDVRRVASTGSTNADLVAAARRGEAEGVVLVAAHQTAGRGRLGRTWIAPAGSSLLCSVLLRPAGWDPPLAPERWHLITAAVGLAAVDAVRDVAGVAADLEWPNDLFVGDRKLAGVLAEGDPAAGFVVVGIGLNVVWPPLVALPDEIADRAIALNHLTDRPVTPDGVLDALLGHLAATDWAELPAVYRRRLDTVGTAVRVQLATEEFEGTATGVTDDGHLVVTTASGAVREVTAGDVVRLHPVDRGAAPG